MQTKTCTKCGETKAVEAFGWACKAKGQRQSRCKECCKAYARTYRVENAERIAEERRKQRAENGTAVREAERRQYHRNGERYRATRRRQRAENAEQIREQNADYYRRNRTQLIQKQMMRDRKNANRVKARRRAHYEANRERIAAERRIYRAANPDKVRDWRRQYLARKAGAKGRASRAQVRARTAYYGGRCWMCGAPATSIDHVKPLAKGGSDWPANLRPACKPCNSGKKDTWPLLF